MQNGAIYGHNSRLALGSLALWPAHSRCHRISLHVYLKLRPLPLQDYRLPQVNRGNLTLDLCLKSSWLAPETASKPSMLGILRAIKTRSGCRTANLLQFI